MMGGRLQLMIAAALLCLAATGSAQARRPPPAVHEMVLGQPAPPPFGYYDFCQREPADCFTADQLGPAPGPAGGLAVLADPELARAAAGGTSAPAKPSYWAFAFRAAQVQPRDAYRAGAAPVGPPAAIRPSASPIRLKFLTRRRSAAGTATSPPEVDAKGRIVMTRQVVARLNRINRDVNGRVVSVSDRSNYGQLDVWDLPLSRNARGWGDCEDYAVEKRHQLLAAGYPMRLLSIALVRTRWDDTHAVLLVETDQGAVALDSFSSWIVPWWKLDYQWIMRQSVRDPGVWLPVLGDGWSGGAAPSPG